MMLIELCEAGAAEKMTQWRCLTKQMLQQSKCSDGEDSGEDVVESTSESAHYQVDVLASQILRPTWLSKRYHGREQLPKH